MGTCENCEYAGRPPYKSPCSECITHSKYEPKVGKMDVREKLVELLHTAHNKVADVALEDDEKTYSDAVGMEADELIAHGVTVQEWISVKDRLPEGSTYVLARLSGGAIYEALCLTKGSKQWCAINREPFVNKDTVTHWMPLPQPPKGE